MNSTHCNAEMEQLKEKIDYFKILAEHYRMDIQAVWLRGIVFTTINSALFTLYGSNYLSREPFSKDLLCIFAILICFGWTLTQWVTSNWISDWRFALCELDAQITFRDGFGKAFHKTEKDNDTRSRAFPINIRKLTSEISNWLFAEERQSTAIGMFFREIHHWIRPQQVARILPLMVTLLWLFCLLA